MYAAYSVILLKVASWKQEFKKKWLSPKKKELKTVMVDTSYF